jgi:hypothetical protein
MAIWNILLPFGIFYGHLVYFTAIWYILWPFGTLLAVWYIFPRFGILNKEKSGNPEAQIDVLMECRHCILSGF